MQFKRLFMILYFSILGVCSLKATPLFSYYTGMDSLDGIIYNAVDIIEVSEPGEEPARGEFGWGYTIPQTAAFTSDSSFITTASDISMSYSGIHIISGEIWVKPYRGGGLLWTWGDTTGSNFLRMRLNSDRSILFERNILDSLYCTETVLTLDTLRHHYIRWFSEVSGDTLHQTLIINNRLVAKSKDYLVFGTGFTILRSPLQLGGRCSPDSTHKPFNGEIHAATLMNVVSQYEMSAYIPLDGSQYAGIPYYWDHDHWKTYTNSPTPVNTLVFVPYAHDDFVPQGLTNSWGDPEFSGPGGMIYISLYNKDITGRIGIHRSIIVELDPGDNYQVRRCFRLRGQLQYGHNGGIAFRNNTIYVAGSGHIEGYRIPAYEGDGMPKYQDLYPLSPGLWDVGGPASFTTCFNDTLWVGDFRDESQDNPYLRGYPMITDGSLSGNPKYYRLPLRSQGCAWSHYENETYLFVSISAGGSNNSILHRFNKKDLSAYYVADPERTFEFPSGSEDLSFDKEGDIWCVSESGARYYQLRASNPWKQFFPFVYETKREVLFQDVDTTLGFRSIDHGILPSYFQISNYPNPFNGKTTIAYSIMEESIVNISVYDIGGREIARLVDNEFRQAGGYEFLWSQPKIPTGIYFVRFTDNHGQQTTCKIVFLK
ncbi:MAG: T9SS type A sorting domain-containing protein [Candidatus Marinimicrobia bacterium]|nr:T9SS type A sorting domain-containing protein [Candidatus Neomarinimicrobiota bacterium]